MCHESSVTLKALQQQDSWTGALDIDRHAKGLLNELGNIEAGTEGLGQTCCFYHSQEQVWLCWDLSSCPRSGRLDWKLQVRDFTGATGSKGWKLRH